MMSSYKSISTAMSSWLLYKCLDEKQVGHMVGTCYCLNLKCSQKSHTIKAPLPGDGLWGRDWIIRALASSGD